MLFMIIQRYCIRCKLTVIKRNPKGSHLAGYLGNLPVYKSTAVAADTWVVGYKGDSLFEAGWKVA